MRKGAGMAESKVSRPERSSIRQAARKVLSDAYSGLKQILTWGWTEHRKEAIALVSVLFIGGGSTVAEAANVPNPLGSAVRHFSPDPPERVKPAPTDTRVWSATISDDLSNKRLRLVEYDDVSLGPPISGSDVMSIGGENGNKLYVETLELSAVNAPRIVVEDASVHVSEITTVEADGVSLQASSSSTTDVLIHTTDTDAALSYARVGSDKGLITAASADGEVTTLRIKASNLRGGDLKIHDAVIGTLKITGSAFGKGDGLTAHDLVIDSSTAVGSKAHSDIVETRVEVR